MNTAAALTQQVLDIINKLETVTPTESKAFFNPSTGEKTGGFQRFKGTEILDNVMVVHIENSAMQLDAYMVSAFTKPNSLYPHLVFDVELQPTDSAFHIDLLHKTDLTINNDYIINILEPLTDAFEAADQHPQFRFSDATRQMKTLLNPWMCSYHTPPEYLPDAASTVATYGDYWLSLQHSQRQRLKLDDNIDVSVYDSARRRALFDPSVDVLWDFLVNLIGRDDRDTILKLLRNDLA